MWKCKMFLNFLKLSKGGFVFARKYRWRFSTTVPSGGDFWKLLGSELDRNHFFDQWYGLFGNRKISRKAVFQQTVSLIKKVVPIQLRSQKLSKIANRWKSATYAILQKQSHLFVISRSSRTFCTSTIKSSLFWVLILCWTFDFGEATRTFFCSQIVKGLTLWQTFTLLSLHLESCGTKSIIIYRSTPETK